MSTIPKHIHLIYRIPVVPPHYASYVGLMRELHPAWQITIYGDEEARTIVADHFPSLLPDYDAYPRDVQRTDLFRLMAVYLFGGFYMDMDMHCLQPLDPLCSLRLVLGEEKTLGPDECRQQDTDHPLRIANYMFGSAPRHPFWLEVIEAARANACKKIAGENDILETTGPGLLTNIYHRTAVRHDDITVLPNKDRICAKWCERISCHFGEYAAHMHHGQWRWEATEKHM